MTQYEILKQRIEKLRAQGLKSNAGTRELFFKEVARNQEALDSMSVEEAGIEV